VFGLLNFTLGLEILQWLVIGVDDDFLAHKTMILFLNNLNQSIKFLIICKKIQDSAMEHFIMITYWLTFFFQDLSHNISTCICIHFKRILQIRDCESWCLINILFELFKSLMLILSPLAIMAWSGATTTENDPINI
jgi:hypothetical protein